jgi:hypothetical protein
MLWQIALAAVLAVTNARLREAQLMALLGSFDGKIWEGF